MTNGIIQNITEAIVGTQSVHVGSLNKVNEVSYKAMACTFDFKYVLAVPFKNSETTIFFERDKSIELYQLEMYQKIVSLPRR